MKTIIVLNDYSRPAIHAANFALKLAQKQERISSWKAFLKKLKSSF